MTSVGTCAALNQNRNCGVGNVNPPSLSRERLTQPVREQQMDVFGGRLMKSRLALGFAALLCICATAAEADTLTWQFDFTGRASGFFEVDATNFVVPASAGQPTTFDVVAADINITDPGWLFGPLHYTLNNLSATSCTPGECSLAFTTQVVVPNFGIYNPTLQLNFAQIWLPWTTVDEQTIFMWFHSETVGNNWNDSGPVQRTVLSAVPELSTWAMMILGFAGIGFMAYRRRAHSAFAV